MDGVRDGLTTVEPSDLGGESIVGRDLELKALRGALEGARRGQGRCLMLAGDAGAGKTTLARAVAREATAGGFLVAWGRCWEGGGAPAFWPWMQIVRALTEELGRDEVVRLAGAGAGYLAQMVPEIVSNEETARLLRSTERDRFQMFDAAATFLKTLSDDRPLLLIFDDLHAADESSLHLLRFLAREIHRSAVMILGTYVGRDVSLDAVRFRLLHAIAREGRVLRVGGLDKDGVAMLYRGVTGEEPPDPVLTAVHEATEGNPFFVDEAIRLLDSRGDLRRPDFSLGFRVPKGARDVLDRRLTALSDDAIWVLTIAAVIGREFEIGTLREVSEIDSTALVDVLQSAVKSGVVAEVDSQGRYAFSHILLREVLYEELTAADRMRLHNEVAQVLEQRFHDDLDQHLGELAHHYFKAAQAGDKKKAVDYALLAADQASRAMAYEEAVRLYRRALRVSETREAGRARREEIRRRLSEAEARVGGDVGSEDGPMVLAEIRGVFVQQGDFWEIEFEGRKFRLRDSKGLRYLSHLLKNPGHEVHSLEVVGLLEGQRGLRRSAAAADPGLEVSDLGDAGEILDPQAKAAYKRRIRDLQEEIEEANAFNDPARGARAQGEMDALLQQLSGAVGLGGRDRRAGSPAERARLSVTKAVKGALAKIRANHPGLGAHLDATIHTGTFCVYRPDPRVPIRWEF